MLDVQRKPDFLADIFLHHASKELLYGSIYWRGKVEIYFDAKLLTPTIDAVSNLSPSSTGANVSI